MKKLTINRARTLGKDMGAKGQQSPERVTGDSARPAVDESGLIEAAAAARSLLSKLSARLEIDEELHAEISRVEETLWGVLFPGAQPPKRKKGATLCGGEPTDSRCLNIAREEGCG